MEGHRFDFIVFGATGFTGQYTVDEVSRVAEEEHLTWAIAGRSTGKLQTVLSDASARTGKNLNDIPIIVADSSNQASLLDMARQGKVVLNCVGPYELYGEPVVKACIEAGTHHLDLSGEEQFLERMQLQYNNKAKENNVFVIGATGFDSIPAEIGVLYTRKHFADGELTNVECFMSLETGSEGLTLNTGTFESGVNMFAHKNELKSVRKSLFPEPLPKLEYTLPKRRAIFYSKEAGKWCAPILSTDKSVVERTVRDLLATSRLQKPIQFDAYFCRRTLPEMLAVVIFMIGFVVLASFSFGRFLLLKYPHIFTLGFFKRGGPTKQQIETTSFNMTFIGYGYDKLDKDRTDKTPNKTVVTKVMGPEAAYVTTPICMVQSAVTLLKEQDKIPHKGGVLTPGAAFWDTSIIDRLQKHNIKFVTVSESSNTSRQK